MPDHARRTLGPGRRLGVLILGAVSLLSAPATGADLGDKQRAVSDAIEQIALLDLRMQKLPLPRDYQLTFHALSIAAALDPDDLELQHKVVAAAWATTDERLLLRATRRLVEMDRSDTVAQLRLISAIINRLQTGEERLAAYERYLGPAGESIDASVRSRLAFDAANLARELGDDERFVELLSVSTRLDVTNKLAATLAMTYHAERREDPVERLEMLFNLLYADPMDSNLHQAIAQLLASEGAFKQARRYFQNAVLIHQHAGDANLSLLQQGLLFQWHDEGPEAVVQTLNDMIARRRQSIAESRAMAEAAGELTDDMPLPEDERLDPSIDRIRALAAAAAGDEHARTESLKDMSLQTTEQVRQLTSYLAGNDEALKRDAMIQMAQLFGELHFTSVLADADPQASARAVQVFAAQAPDLNRLIRWLIPWITLRLDQVDQALSVRDYLETGLGTDLFDAEVALARGQRAEAARGFLSVMRQSPISPLGAWAGSRLKTLIAADDVRTQDGKRMDAFARSVPPLIDKMIKGPSEFMNVRFRPVKRTLEPGEVAMVSIRIQNTSTIPLGLGPGRPISSRFLVQPHIDTEIGRFESEPQPEVVEIDRRLRLMPLESVEVTVPADSPFTRWLLDLNAESTMRQSWRLLQGFRASREQGAMAKGPLCHSAETSPMVIRRPISPEPLTVGELARRLRTASDEKLRITLVGARAALLRVAADARNRAAPGTDDLVQAAIERYERAEPLDRSLMLCMLPHATMVPAMAPFDERVRELLSAEIRSGDPIDQVSACMVLLTRSTTESDALLAESLESGAPALRDIADLLRRRTAQGGSGFAQATAHPTSLVGPTLSLLREQAAAADAAQAESAAQTPPSPPVVDPGEGG